MAENAGAAQARELLIALHRQIADTSGKLEVAERRGRTSIRGAAHDRREVAALWRELREAHRLVDGLYRRFPETAPPRRWAQPRPEAASHPSGDQRRRVARVTPG